MPSTLELFSWGPAWGLSSFDPFCMSIQSYLSLSGVDWTSTKSSNPKISPSGELPLLRDGTIPISGRANIVRHLKRKACGYDLDADLSALQLAQSASYINLIETKLYDSLLHTLFVDAKNYNEDTLRVYSKQLDFVRRFYVPEVLKKRVIGRLAGYRMMLNDKEELVNEVYLNAKDIFKALNDKLGEQQFFFGDKPTTLDAVAYAHLSMHALPILTNPNLHAILTFNFPKLTAYLSRMQDVMARCPPPAASPAPPPLHIISLLSNPSAAILTLAEETRRSWTSLTAERPREARVEVFWKWFSVLGACGFFVGYVISHGIIQIQSVEGDEEDFHVEETEHEDSTDSFVFVDEDGNVFSGDE
ncbi:hypothetical protein BC830DRAFT_1059198 [Chytriomyces sp. MP71]|nr:hypothetical protein BC830DRAFT_1059198 [Chytriomyces sp. MP71]